MIKRIIIILIGAGILCVLFLPINFDKHLDLPAQVVPIRKWLLIRSQNGIITAVTVNNYYGSTSETVMLIPYRGDRFTFTLDPSIQSSTWITENSEVGSITSAELQRDVSRLKGEVKTSKANLEFLSSSSKQPVITELEMKLEYARIAAGQQKKILDRAQSLYDSKMISLEKYELESNKYDLDMVNIRIAESALEAAKSGVKPERLNLESTRLEVIWDDINVIDSVFIQKKIISPVSGRPVAEFSPDTLFQIIDTTTMVLILPVTPVQRNILSQYPDAALEIILEGSSIPVTDLRRDPILRTVADRQVVLFFGKLFNHGDLMPGSVIKCRFNLGQERLIDYAKGFLFQQ